MYGQVNHFYLCKNNWQLLDVYKSCCWDSPFIGACIWGWAFLCKRNIFLLWMEDHPLGVTFIYCVVSTLECNRHLRSSVLMITTFVSYVLDHLWSSPLLNLRFLLDCYILRVSCRTLWICTMYGNNMICTTFSINVIIFMYIEWVRCWSLLLCC